MNNVLNLNNIQLRYEINGDESLEVILTKVESNFLNGEKSIAFGSTHYKNSQEKTILLSCDFFNKKFPSLRILVVSFDINSGLFSDFIKESRKHKNLFFEFSSRLYFINWEDVLTNGHPNEYVDSFDMVFWDLPDLKIITQKQKDLKASFDLMDSLYIVSLKNDKFDEEAFKREILHYYQDHGLDIRNILPWQFGSKKRKKRTLFSRFIYKFFKR